ncbi:MAG: hypothetical protein H0V82_06895 [Candidatus Protochlamydia sp.]|nr:hypothetical protein [Candidatus Protochlamydia sp.]
MQIQNSTDYNNNLCRFNITSGITPPNREEFIRAIQTFEDTHQLKLEEFITGKAWWRNQNYLSEEQARCRTAFFNDPIIQNYLSRHSKFVNFLENRPNLNSDENKPYESDYFECKIYELAAKNDAMFLPYRKDVMTDLFYESRTSDPSIFRNMQSKASGKIKLTRKGYDLYEIRDYLRRVEFGKYSDKIEKDHKGIEFIISPIGKDGHAMTILSVIQKNTFKHLASIFINSFTNNDYYNLISNRFNLRENHSYALLEGSDCEKFFEQIFEKLSGKSTLIDLDLREGYILNPSFGVNLSSEEKPIHDALQSQKIDLIHTLNKYETDTMYGIYGTRIVTMIDASHTLQTQENDENCALYSLNFLQGIIDLLKNDDKAEIVYQLAEKIDSSNPLEKEFAKKSLSNIFNIVLRQYLPAYYNSEGIQKSEEEIKRHHLYQRWDLGSQGMHPDYLKESGYLPK